MFVRIHLQNETTVNDLSKIHMQIDKSIDVLFSILKTHYLFQQKQIKNPFRCTKSAALVYNSSLVFETSPVRVLHKWLLQIQGIRK